MCTEASSVPIVRGSSQISGVDWMSRPLRDQRIRLGVGGGVGWDPPSSIFEANNAHQMIIPELR